MHFEGQHLSHSEKLAAVNWGVDSPGRDLFVAESVRNATAKVIAMRPPQGEMKVLDLDATPGKSWVAIREQADGTCVLMSWSAGQGQPRTESTGNLIDALERADTLAQELRTARAEQLQARGETAWVVVPKPGSMASRIIDSASGIVAKRQGQSVRVYFEGNRMGAENLQQPEQRVVCAAGRLFKKYPTIAMTVYNIDDFCAQFAIVGNCSDDYQVVIHDEGEWQGWQQMRT